MRAPLMETREKVQVFRGDMEEWLLAVRCAAERRANVSVAKEVLELLIDTSNGVSKVYIVVVYVIFPTYCLTHLV